MKEYKVQKGDTLDLLAEKLGMPSGYALKTFHNFKGPIDRGIGDEIKEGMILTVPEPHEADAINKEIEEIKESKQSSEASSSEESQPKSETEKQEKQNKKEEKKKDEEKESSEKSTGEHDGKLFIAQKGKAICDKGTKFPQFKVTSHQKHYINDKDGSADYLAVTENDLQFNPPVVPFGNCSVKNGQPCSFAPAGKWKKFYKDVKVMGNCLLTEISELQCTVGGKIKIMDHGQKAQLSKQNLKNANSKVHHHINPLVDLEELNDEGDDFYV